jgi:hypothetical protein
MTLPARIETRLIPEPNTGCLLWEGASDRKGYGVVWFEGHRRRVHRVVFQFVKGRKPRRDRELLHSCDTPACSEPMHLKEGTRRQNARDRHAKGRTKGVCAKYA